MEAPSLTTNHKPQHWSSILLAALVTANVAGAVSMPPALAAAPDTIVGPARVVDGDTLYIGNDKFRLYGVGSFHACACQAPCCTP
jgi:endonuclease YncB( thermonuclease family)